MAEEKQFDFDTPVNRRGTNAVKWDVTAEGELPMWVADMDFLTAPAVREAVERRAAHGIFGYADVTDEWYDAYIGWWRDRHGLVMQRDWLVYATGVIPALSSIVRKLTTPAEKVVIQTPVYNIFFNSIRNSGREILESPLLYEGGEYRMDLDDLEKKLADPQTAMMILCNPHNPVGRIWDRETLAAVGELCKRYGVILVSDEIHCDITAPGKDYVPLLSVSDTCREIGITCMAPGKTFNIAGLHTAAVAVPDPFLRHKVWRGLNTDEVGEPNVFAVDAVVAAYTKGHAWTDALREYLFENRRVAEEALSRLSHLVRVTPAEATYLLWLDCTGLGTDGDTFADFLREKTGLLVSKGSQYGMSGKNFLRWNVACPRVTLYDGIDRMKEGIRLFTETHHNK